MLSAVAGHLAAAFFTYPPPTPGTPKLFLWAIPSWRILPGGRAFVSVLMAKPAYSETCTQSPCTLIPHLPVLGPGWGLTGW